MISIIHQSSSVASNINMKLILTILLLVQAASLSLQNYDTNCFDQYFPSALKESATRSSEASINVWIVQTREWTGSTGSIRETVKDEIHTIPENVETRLTYIYEPRPYNNPDYNPRYLTLLFDGTSLMAAIGRLEEEAGPSVLTHTATWAGCEHTALPVFMKANSSTSATLTFEENSQIYPLSGVWGTGREQLFIQIQ